MPPDSLDDLLPLRQIQIQGTPQQFASILNLAGDGFAAVVTENDDGTQTLTITFEAATGVTSVAGTPPIVSSGGATPAISITAATESNPGSMSAADKVILDGLAGGSVPSSRSIATTAPLTGGGNLSADRTLAISAASGGAAGSMSATDKTKLDTFAPSSPAQGDVLYFDGSHWVNLGHGTAGQFLQTAGASANPVWATATSAAPDLGDLFGTSRVQHWAGGFSGGTLSGFLNCQISVSGGSGGAVGPTAGTYLQSTARYEQQLASSTGFCGFYETSNKNWAWRGNGAGLGGFRMYTSFAIEETNTAATMSIFIGLSNLAAATRPSTANFNTQTTLDAIGFGTAQATSGAGAFSGNWKIISCDGTTTNLVDSGLAITKGHLYLFMLSCIANDTLISWKITDLSAGTSASGTVNTNLPRTNQFMGWQAGLNASVAGSGGDGSNSPSLARYTLETLQ